MKQVLDKQLEKEKTAVKKIWGGYLRLLFIVWGIFGLILLLTPAWPLGLALMGASYYVYYRTKHNTYNSPALMKWSYIIAGAFFVLGGLGSFGGETTVTDNLWYSICVAGGGYLIYFGFSKYKKGTSAGMVYQAEDKVNSKIDYCSLCGEKRQKENAVFCTKCGNHL